MLPLATATYGVLAPQAALFFLPVTHLSSRTLHTEQPSGSENRVAVTEPDAELPAPPVAARWCVRRYRDCGTAGRAKRMNSSSTGKVSTVVHPDVFFLPLVGCLVRGGMVFCLRCGRTAASPAFCTTCPLPGGRTQRSITTGLELVTPQEEYLRFVAAVKSTSLPKTLC